jgi:NADPH2:quinone reductase
MQAWRVHEIGHYREKLRLEDCPLPDVPSSGVRIAVAAAGINFPDLLAIAGKYQVRPPLPFVPGLEAVGVIEKVGSQSRFKVGQRVIANGMWGAFAQNMAALDAMVFPVPDEMTDEDAAALLITYQTSYFALVHRTTIAAGETLLVHGGAGGVGTAAIQIGKQLGARVIATAGSDVKLEVCRRAGADHVINYRDSDFVAEVKELTDGDGADVIYDPVGGDVFDKSTRCIAWEGRLLVIGFASGRIPEIAANRILLKNIAVIGVHWGNYFVRNAELVHSTHEVLCEMYTSKQIVPIIYRQFSLAELPDALGALESRDSFGKVVISLT